MIDAHALEHDAVIVLGCLARTCEGAQEDLVDCRRVERRTSSRPAALASLRIVAKLLPSRGVCGPEVWVARYVVIVREHFNDTAPQAAVQGLHATVGLR